jgi:hypothetical protein
MRSFPTEAAFARKPVTIYMPLLNEGVDVWRPVQAEPRADGTYRVLGPVPETEEWEFAPGSVVRCRSKTLSCGAEQLVPYEQISS